MLLTVTTTRRMLQGWYSYAKKPCFQWFRPPRGVRGRYLLSVVPIPKPHR